MCNKDNQRRLQRQRPQLKYATGHIIKPTSARRSTYLIKTANRAKLSLRRFHILSLERELSNFITREFFVREPSAAAGLPGFGARSKMGLPRELAFVMEKKRHSAVNSNVRQRERSSL